MKTILYILSIFLLSSCYTQKKAAKQLDKAADEYPALVADKFRNEFPCPQVGTDSVVVSYRDSVVYVECPEIAPSVPDTVTVVLPGRVETKTVRVPVTLPIREVERIKWYEDSAKILVAMSGEREARQQLTEWQCKAERRGKWNKWLIIACIILGGGHILRSKLRL